MFNLVFSLFGHCLGISTQLPGRGLNSRMRKLAHYCIPTTGTQQRYPALAEADNLGHLLSVGGLSTGPFECAKLPGLGCLAC